MNTLNLRTLLEGPSTKNYPIWHPFSNLNRHFGNTLTFTQGDGVYLYDTEKKEYLDASSGLWNVNLGYGNKFILEAITEQLNKLQYCSLFDYTNATAILAARKILDMLPDYFEKIFFTNSGSESIELSMKVMRQYWHLQGQENKDIIISFKNSYHGTYYGSMGVSGIEGEMIEAYGPLLQNIKFTDPGVCFNCDNNLQGDECGMKCCKELEDYISQFSDRIAGVIAEPILASNGVTIVSQKYLQKLRSLCSKHGLLFVVDEVALGFYRTGAPFYSLKHNLNPDMICMAKGINGGYLPLGAVALSQNITDAFQRVNATLIHGSTQSGNIISCAACISAIELYEKYNTMDNVNKMGDYLKSRLSKRLENHRNIGNIRGEGLLLGIDLVDNKKSYNYLEQIKIKSIQEKLKKEGLIVYSSNLGLTLLPMLIMNEAQADFIIDTLEKVFKNLLFN